MTLLNALGQGPVEGPVEGSVEGPVQGLVETIEDADKPGGWRLPPRANACSAVVYAAVRKRALNPPEPVHELLPDRPIREYSDDDVYSTHGIVIRNGLNSLYRILNTVLAQ